MHAMNTLTLGANKALYIGDLPATGWHRHASPVLLIGLSGRFTVHLPGGRIESCHSALIDTGVEHLFDPCGERVALIYLEPDSMEARRLRSHFQRDGQVIFDPAVRPVSRSRFDSYLSTFDLQALLRFSYPEAVPLDQRVARSILFLRMAPEKPIGRDAAASAVQLSPSHFNHLFRSETGVSFRSYRVWSQVRAAMTGLGRHVNLTDAALCGSFVDSSHFSRTFRQTFGMTPSSVLKPLKHITLL
jgi:AraC-like DNA-binding protein